MTRKNKKYQLLISTLLLCFLQMAGIDVYAQAPVTPVQKDTTITHREPPKARARRHRDPMQEQDSLRKDSIVLPPKHLQSIDSLSAAKIQVADSLDAANKKELKKIEQPAAKMGWIEEDRIVCEMAASAYRAGASIYLTYYAKELARFIDEGRIG